MTFRRFTMTRIASAISSSLPIVIYKPYVLVATPGQVVTYLSSTFIGSGAAITLTEIITSAGAVLASATSNNVVYTVQDTDIDLRVRQTVSSPGGTVTTASYQVNVINASTDWDIPLPVVAVGNTPALLQAATQVGSRLYYVSYSAGVIPSQVTYYLWNGTNIIDNTGSTTGAGGVAYGNDPRNPSGPVIASKYWSAVGPCTEDKAIGIRTGNGGGSQINPGATSFQAYTRARAPDWWLFKRGDVFNLDNDIVEYKTYATAWTAVDTMLSVNGGESKTTRQVVTAYGDYSNPRPKFNKPKAVAGNTPLVQRVGTFKNVLYSNLHFDGATRNPDQIYYPYGVIGTGLDANSLNIKFQDVFFDEMGTGDICAGTNNKARAEFFRCVVTDVWSGIASTTNISAAHSSGVPGAMVLLNQCWIARGGYANVNPARIEDPDAVFSDYNSSNAYPAGSIVKKDGELYQTNLAVSAGTAFVETTSKGLFAGWRRISDFGGKMARGTSRERNLYMDGPTTVLDCVVLRGPTGEQFRDGVILKRNFIQAGYINFNNNSAKSDDDSFSGLFEDNVQQMVYQQGLHTGVGITLGIGARNVEVNRHIITGAQQATSVWGISLAAIGSAVDIIGDVVWAKTRNNKFKDCIIDAGAGTPVQLTDGVRVTSGAVAQPQAVYPMLTDNHFEDTVFISSSANPNSVYTALTEAPTTNTTTTFTNCERFANRAAAASAKGYTNTERTVATYAADVLGLNVRSVDGVHEMVQIAKTMSQQNWPANMQSKALVNYVRAGWGKSALV